MADTEKGAQFEKSLVFVFFASVVLSCFALIVLGIVVLVPNTVGTDHKIYILGVIGSGLFCTIVLLIKARNDFASLLIWTKISDVISAFVIGIAVGQLTRHLKL